MAQDESALGNYGNASLPNTEDIKEWENALHQLCGSIDISMIDISDERTQYIMSK